MEIYDHNTLHIEPASTPPQKSDGMKIVFAVLCVVLAVALTVVSVCLAFARTGGKESTESYEKTFAAVRSSVVRVEVGLPAASRAGSGVVYKIRGGDTFVLTNQHVIADAASVRLEFADSAITQIGEVLGYDEYHDIALVKVAGSFGTPVKAADAPAIATSVLAVGNNLGTGISAFDGIVSHNDRLLEVGDKLVPVYGVTSPINAGMSGGGVFATGGKIIGIGTYQVGAIKENGKERPVDGASYCVPFCIAQKIAECILREESGGQVETALSVYADPYLANDIVFEDLFFSVRRTQRGYTVDNDSYVSSEMSAAFEEGDILERFGSLTVTAQTPFWALFDEALTYGRGNDGATLSVSLLRGTERVTVEFKRVKKSA